GCTPPRDPSLLTHSLPPHTYTPSLHDALPIYLLSVIPRSSCPIDRSISQRVSHTMPLAPTARRRIREANVAALRHSAGRHPQSRSEEHTSELQSRENLVCRPLLAKKKNSNSVS